MNVNFIHIAKNCGISTLDILKKYGRCVNPRQCPKTDDGGKLFQFVSYGHSPYHRSKMKSPPPPPPQPLSDLRIDRVVAFKRHPYSRFLSSWNFLKSQDGSRKADTQVTQFQMGAIFKFFCEWLNLKYEDSIVDFLASSDFREIIDSPHGLPWLKPQSFFVGDSLDGIEVYDADCYRTELKRLMRDLGVEENIEIPHLNRSKKLKTTLTAVEKEAVFKAYQSDFTLFGYNK